MAATANFTAMVLRGVDCAGLIRLIPKAGSFVGLCRVAPACSLTKQAG